MRRRNLLRFLTALPLLASLPTDPARADQVVPDDLIVQGSTCTGFDCVNNESFPFDIVRLKENNLRIVFADESDPGAAASGDWQITANDSANGGRNRLSIDDLSSATIPLWISGGAPTDALYLAATGRLGLGTANPQSALHVGGSVRIDGDLVVTGGLRAGRVPVASLTRNGRGTVTFSVPYARDYAITLTPVRARSKGSASVVVLSRDETGFTFAVSGSTRDLVEVVWTTRFTGEF